MNTLPHRGLAYRWYWRIAYWLNAPLGWTVTARQWYAGGWRARWYVWVCARLWGMYERSEGRL